MAATIVKAELPLGAAESNQSKRTRRIVEALLYPFERIAFDAEAAEQYARIRASLKKRGHRRSE